MTQRVVTLIQTKNLSKHYGEFTAISGISLSIDRGCRLVIAGPNGGGKTTLLDCLSGLLEPDSQIMIERLGGKSELSHIEIRRSIGYAPDEDDTIDFLTGEEYCALVAAAYKAQPEQSRTAVGQILTALDFDASDLTKLIKTYSHGMRKKIQLAALLAVNPPILIIDEPTNGLDPTAIIRLKKILNSKRYAHTAIIIATHNLGFAETIQGDVLLLNREVLLHGQTKTVLDQHHVKSLEDLYAAQITATR